MKIPERLSIEANRYGNKIMIQKIENMFPINNDEYTLICILPDRAGIKIMDTTGNVITLLAKDLVMGQLSVDIKEENKNKKKINRENLK